MLFNSAIVVWSFANKLVKVQPRKFVRSLYGVPRTLQYLCTEIKENEKIIFQRGSEKKIER